MDVQQALLHVARSECPDEDALIRLSPLVLNVFARYKHTAAVEVQRKRAAAWLAEVRAAHPVRERYALVFSNLYRPDIIFMNKITMGESCSAVWGLLPDDSLAFISTSTGVWESISPGETCVGVDVSLDPVESDEPWLMWGGLNWFVLRNRVSTLQLDMTLWSRSWPRRAQ